MNTTQRIGIACFLGAGLGSLLALQFNHYFWWAGVLIGGGLGYFSYQFREVLTGLKNAGAELRRGIFNWKPDKLYWRTVTKQAFIDLVVLLPWALVILYALFSFIAQADPTLKRIIPLLMAGAISIMFIFLPLSSSQRVTHLPRSEWERCAQESIEYIFPAFLPIVLMWYFPRFLFWLAQKCCRGVQHSCTWIKLKCPIFCKICKGTFVAIHSEIRLLCMADSMVGGLIGYVSGHALIGGIAGALIGLLNYEIVSKRLLKLVPV